MNNANLDVTKELGLTDIKKYWRRAGQVEKKVDWHMTGFQYWQHL